MALLMAATVWDRLQEQAVDAVSGGEQVESDFPARRLLAMCGGDRRTVIATRIRLAAMVAHTPDALNPRRALALVDEAIGIANAEGHWHPVFTEHEAWNVSSQHPDR
jgi:hypothetical protein